MKKTLCFLTDYMVLGGLEKVVCQAIRELSASYEITVQALFGGVDPGVAAQIEGHARIVTQQRPRRDLYLMQVPGVGGLHLNKLIPERYDVLVVLRPWFIMAGYSRVAEKIIYWCHTDKDVMYANGGALSFLRKLNRLRLRSGYRQFDSVWVVNDEIRDSLRQAFGALQVETLPNPVDCSRIRTLARCPMNPEPFVPGRTHIVVVGRLSAEKGQHRVLNAIRDGTMEKPYQITFVGDGSDRAALEETARTNGLMDRVCFVGNQDNPYPYIQRADALLLPSFTESFGLVMLEAMVLGTPVIATNTVGSRFLTQNGAVGTCVENSTEGIRRGLQEFLNNSTAYAPRTAAAAAWADHFDNARFAAKLHRMLQ